MDQTYLIGKTYKSSEDKIYNERSRDRFFVVFCPS